MVRSVAAALLVLLIAAPAAQATFPGRDGRIAVSQPRSGILVMKPNGRASHRISEPDTYAPAWSADGKRIAFALYAPPTTLVFVARADGGEPAQVFLPFAANSPAWAPDGRSLLVTKISGDGERRRDVYQVGLDGSELRSLIPNALEATFSPDGRRIAYVALGRDGCRRLAIARPDGTDREVVVDRISRGEDCTGSSPTHPTALARRGNVFMPDWRPDGRRLVYARDGAAFELDPATGAERILARATGPAGRPIYLLSPRWSPDGRRIAFSTGTVTGWQSWAMTVGSTLRKGLRGGPYLDWQPLP